MGQLSETLETIREHLRAAADESQRYILSAETREEQVAAVLRTHTLARLGLVRLVRESVEHEPDGGRRATIESEATAAGRELLWVLDGNAPAADGLDVVAERMGVAWMEKGLDAAVEDGRLTWWKYTHGAGHWYNTNGVPVAGVTRLEAATAAAEYVRALRKQAPKLPDVESMSGDECEAELDRRRWMWAGGNKWEGYIRGEYAVAMAHATDYTHRIRAALARARELDAEAQPNG